MLDGMARTSPRHRGPFGVVRVAALSAMVTLGLSGVAAGQSISDLVSRAGVGLDVGFVQPLDSDVDIGPAYGVYIGLAPKAGWGLAGSLGWFSGDLLIDTGSGERDAGQIRVRPLMGGVGYTWVTGNGKVATTALLTAGISFNSADIDDDYRQTFGPGADLSLELDNSLAVRPALEIEYFVTPKFSLTAYTNLFLTRIDSELKTPIGNFSDRWNASSFQGFVGVMFYPFR
jgi:hypothetical protein